MPTGVISFDRVPILKRKRRALRPPISFVRLFKQIMSYSERLKDTRWRLKRARILYRDNFTCRWCGIRDEAESVWPGNPPKIHLEVHHFEYASSFLPWDVPDDWLVTLCAYCHTTVTKTVGRIIGDGDRERERFATRNKILAEAEAGEEMSRIFREESEQVLKGKRDVC